MPTTRQVIVGLRGYARLIRIVLIEVYGFSATALMLVAFDGFRPSRAPAGCSPRQPLSDEFFV